MKKTRSRAAEFVEEEKEKREAAVVRKAEIPRNAGSAEKRGHARRTSSSWPAVRAIPCASRCNTDEDVDARHRQSHAACAGTRGMTIFTVCPIPWRNSPGHTQRMRSC